MWKVDSRIPRHVEVTWWSFCITEGWTEDRLAGLYFLLFLCHLCFIPELLMWKYKPGGACVWSLGRRFCWSCLQPFPAGLRAPPWDLHLNDVKLRVQSSWKLKVRKGALVIYQVCSAAPRCGPVSETLLRKDRWSWEKVISSPFSPVFVSGIKRNFETYIPNINEIFLELESYLY